MLNRLKSRNQGFTIVETLIVLAIAGLIILIVLLAVPALQRSSRNTNIKNDASAIAAGISEYESNNAGALPADVYQGLGTDAGTVYICDADPCTAAVASATAKIQASDKINLDTAKNPPTSTAYKVGNIDVDLQESCNGTTGFGVTSSPRSVALIYSIETSGTSNGSSTAGSSVECVSS